MQQPTIQFLTSSGPWRCSVTIPNTGLFPWKASGQKKSLPGEYNVQDLTAVKPVTCVLSGVEDISVPQPASHIGVEIQNEQRWQSVLITPVLPQFSLCSLASDIKKHQHFFMVYLGFQI